MMFDIPTLPVAVTVFPTEIERALRSWGEQSFGNLICTRGTIDVNPMGGDPCPNSAHSSRSTPAC